LVQQLQEPLALPEATTLLTIWLLRAVSPAAARVTGQRAGLGVVRAADFTVQPVYWRAKSILLLLVRGARQFIKVRKTTAIRHL
jgi:hypothetical protein